MNVIYQKITFFNEDYEGRIKEYESNMFWDGFKSRD